MLKLTLMSLAALSAVGLNANDAAAQCACGGAATQSSPAMVQSVDSGVPMASANGAVATDTQTYQRFSYSLTEIAQPTMAASPMIMDQPATTYQPMMGSAVVAPRTQSQSYRRFSYQPGRQSRNSNTTHKQSWQYSKADPRRYRP